MTGRHGLRERRDIIMVNHCPFGDLGAQPRDKCGFILSLRRIRRHSERWQVQQSPVIRHHAALCRFSRARYFLNRCIKLWEASSGELQRALPGHTGLCGCICEMNQWGRCVEVSSACTVRGHSDGRLCCGSRSAWLSRDLKRVHGLPSGVSALRFVEDESVQSSTVLASASWDGSVAVWNFRSGALLLSLMPDPSPPAHLPHMA